MVIIACVAAWALIEAGIAIALAVRPAARRDQPNIFGRMVDWQS